MGAVAEPSPTLPGGLSTDEVLDLIFRDPTVKHGLAEFRDLRRRLSEILNIYPRVIEAGRARGEVRYYLTCIKRQIPIQVLSDKKTNPEEIVRQLWLYKLQNTYGYQLSHIEVEYPVTFGTVTADKAADILVFQQDQRTAKIIIEVKSPDRKDGLTQLKSYLNAEGSPVGVWSNGLERVILYRPYPREFDDTLTELPDVRQQPSDVLQARLTLTELRREFDFKRIIQNLEELVLANAGVDEFNEIFKIIYAKIYDENAAKDRLRQEVMFRKSDDPQTTYETIDRLFRSAIEEWPSIFEESEHIRLTPNHLQVVVGPLERIRLLGASMRVMDDAFEYLMPTVAKKKNGQFFTPRYVIDMCVKMLNPTRREVVLDPACGSAGFLLHVMDYAWPLPEGQNSDTRREDRKHSYAARYLWGYDFDERSAKVARALMLIAGDGRSHIFRVNTLDPREWFADREGEALRNALSELRLLSRRPPAGHVIREQEAWDYLKHLKFDVIVTNPPFAGEIRDRQLLRQYTLAERAFSRGRQGGSKEERDVLFIERCLDMLKPAGRLAIVLPQGKFNNASLGYIRDWLLRRARLMAIVGLHPNTFKPHTGTKTSVLVVQKYTENELANIADVEARVRTEAPNYGEQIATILAGVPQGQEVDEANLADEMSDMLTELYDVAEDSSSEEPATGESQEEDGSVDFAALEEAITTDAGVVEELGSKLQTAMAARDRAEGRRLRVLLRAAKKALRDAEEALQEAQDGERRQTVRGRLELLLRDDEALGELQERWISAGIARALNYPIFMATSEIGGKKSSGDYIYRKDAEGRLVEDELGNPMVEQDCVKYRPDDPDGIAEQFVEWARTQRLSFWPR